MSGLRTLNKNNACYKDYGGRGIKVCDDWLGKEGHKNFQKWALENGWEKGLSIDRINVNGNYEPNNCRWATPSEQANNRRNNDFYTIKGVTKTCSEWAHSIGISYNAFMNRIRYGWDEDRILKPKTVYLKMSDSEKTAEILKWRTLAEQGRLGGIEEYQKRLVRYIDAGKYRSADKKVFSENDVVYLIEHGIFPCETEAEQALAERQNNE